MLFMIVETFEKNDMVPVYQRLAEKGRGVPDGLAYVDSWVAADFSRCFQIMECSDARLLQEWALHWRGTGAAFEIVPITPAKDTRQIVTRYLDRK